MTLDLRTTNKAELDEVIVPRSRTFHTVCYVLNAIYLLDVQYLINKVKGEIYG